MITESITKTNSTRSAILLALALAVSSAACGSDPAVGAADAYLTIQGDSSVFLEPGFQRSLAVKYHDGQGNALTGQVNFEILGQARGSTLNKASGATDAQGEARLTLYAGQQETVVRIKATAEFATPVEWTVSVSEGAVSKKMDIRGTYDLDSDFDVLNGLPGSVGTVTNTFADMTDGPNDPATYFLDQLLDGQSSGVVSTVTFFRPLLDGVLNDVIKNNAPGVVSDLIDLGNVFGQVSRRFGLVSTMKITGDSIESNNIVGTHTITAFSFKIDSDTFILTMNELGVSVEVIPNITVGYDRATGTVSFAKHTVPLHYGGFLAMALEQVIVPRIDPNAASLKELLSNRIDCAAVGISMADSVGLVGATFYEGACKVGIEAAASIILQQLRGIDTFAPVKMIINGSAVAKDRNGDKKADALTGGKWSGSMEYNGSLGPLKDGANPFTGSRVN